jgi:DNA-binding NarL/FixJ family response regulator
MEFGSQNFASHMQESVALLRYANTHPQLLQSLRLKYRLTPTQTRVATLLADRLTNKEIALELRIRPSTARRHTEAVLLRLGVNSRFKVAAMLAALFAAGERS